MKRLAVLGASGHGKVVADAAELAGWNEIVFFDDAWPSRNTNGIWKVAGDTTSLLAAGGQFDGVVVAIGDNRVRLEKQNLLLERSLPVVSVIHPAAVVSRYAAIGTGSVLFAGAVVNAGAALGQGCIINTGASVDHDCVLEAGVHVSPGARLGGAVRVGKITWIGIGACVRQCVSIGAGAMVGAGAAVVSNVPDSVTVVGVPARAVPPSGDI
ncbi:MAG: NeuD/PglB/VioB family sugar acetyltransferase [Pseudomonadota bacterium]|jgi:sugar O-acyltransferase (sialic acid O-acetyltransferase NeuD family)